MKEFPRPIDVMKTMHQYVADAYKDLPQKETGTIQFCLTENHEIINCYFCANGEEMIFCEGISELFNVRLDASFGNWLALAQKKLNPIVGTIIGKLKFTGDVSYFKKLIPKDLYLVNLEPFTDKITDFEKTPTFGWEKPKKVLLIDSSPRGNKGYTKLYCDKIESFLKEKNVEVKHILLSQYKIQNCLGCLQCWLKKDGECILKDDVKYVYKLYEESDLIFYAFPLYAYGVPGILKNFIDRGVMRQHPYFEKGINEIRHPRREKSNKSIVVFSICGFPSFSQFDSVKPFFKLYSHSSHTPLIAEIYRPAGIFLLQNPFNYMLLVRFLKALRTATHEIVDYGKIRKNTYRSLKIKISQNSFLDSTNKYWDNLFKSRNLNY